MAGPTDAARNIAADAVAASVTALSLHTADPATTGAAEVTGGTYARQVPTYAAAATGTADLTAAETFDIPTGTTITHWNAWAGTTSLGGQALAAPETFASAGTYSLNSAPITG